jgi:hypothetical protein
MGRSTAVRLATGTREQRPGRLETASVDTQQAPVETAILPRFQGPDQVEIDGT